MTLFRVRRRMMDYDKESNSPKPDTDGVEGEPDTWSRWEAEYWYRAKDARASAADKKGALNALRPSGVIDRKVLARVLASEYEGELELEGGLFRRIEQRAEYNRGG